MLRPRHAVLLLCGVLLTATVGVGPTLATARPLCGPARAPSRFEGGGVRIFTRGDSFRAHTFACDEASKEQVQIADSPVSGPFAVAGSWVAGIDTTLEGVDSAQWEVVAADLSTHERSRCAIGAGDRPGQYPRIEQILASTDGRIAVAADVPLGEGPELAVCYAGSLEVVAAGDELDLSSVKLRGRSLSWAEGGRLRHLRL